MNISAPIYMARASYAHSVIDDNVINAQNELIQEFENIYAGANTDILGITYRDDDIHLNKYGLEEHAKLWLSYLK
ncbi:MAG TPA: hypothetical protein EYG97_02160 [Arcobacter sp.]|nr:hypothetical protein [Arcobacter sp.]